MVFLLTLAVTGGCAAFPMSSGMTLLEEIDLIVSTPPLDQVSWGIRIEDSETGQAFYNRNAHLKFVPASNMKILSTATALSLLGADHRFETTLLGVGTIEEGGEVLNGDLLLLSSGDPTLSERFYPSAEAPLDSLAQGLWEKGVRTVSGSLVVDVSRWDSTSIPGSWEVGDLPESFASSGGAFSIAEGSLTVEVTAGAEEGSPTRARWWPRVEEDFLSVSFLTARTDSSGNESRSSYLPESRRLSIKGRIGVGQTDTLRVSQRDPVRLASKALLRSLERRGIDVRGGVRVAWEKGEEVGPAGCTTSAACPQANRLAGLTSPRLAEIVKGILEPSQNWMAEQLVRALGSELGEHGSWQEGFRIQREFLTREVGVDSLDLVFRDGSGISGKNLVTPRALVQVLNYMRASPHGGLFQHALASPGEEESTLRSRLPGLESRVFAKTGTLTHVNSLSGFLITDSGRELTFSILSNGSGLSATVVRNAIDAITEAAARH